MAGYNLDEKSGLFGIGVIKSPLKVLKKDDEIKLNHYSTYDLLNTKVIEVGEDTVKIQIKEGTSQESFKTSDHVVANFISSQDKYIMNGIIIEISNQLPLELTIRVHRIEKLKDVKKSEKYYVSIPTDLKIIGIPDSRPAVVKALSLGSIKLNCSEDILMEDIIEGNIRLDKFNKFNFKGKIVRKNKIGELFEYGIEIIELTESNSKILYKFVNQLISA
jgi:hypothetical protein